MCKNDKVPMKEKKSNNSEKFQQDRTNNLFYSNIMQLQSIIGNKAVTRLLSNENTEQQSSNPVQMKKENNTGLPDNLKEGIESLSGISMDDVRVHYNSDSPLQVGALAYTKGTNIHVAPGQEKHLPHEAWHVVQQKQGRVKPTMQMKNGVDLNDDTELEKEADLMGEIIISKSNESKKDKMDNVLINKDFTKQKGWHHSKQLKYMNTTKSIMQEKIYIKDEEIDPNRISNKGKYKTKINSLISSNDKAKEFKLDSRTIRDKLKEMALDTNKFRFDSLRDAVNKSIISLIPSSTSFGLWNIIHENVENDAELIRIIEKREERKIGESEKEIRKEVYTYLSTLKMVKMGFEEGINFGNLVSGLTLIQSLQELGFKGNVTIVCSDKVYEKLKKLNPKITALVHQCAEEFDTEHSYDVNSIDDSILNIMPTGDLIDKGASKKFLDYMNANSCLILAPYGWENSGVRRVLMRGEDEVEIEKMDESMNKDALYSYSIEQPKNLIGYLEENLKKDDVKKKDGIISIVKNVRDNKIELMPVYGLHRLDGTIQLLNTEAYLVEGIKKAEINYRRPVVILMLSNSRLDIAPMYETKDLIRGNITQPDIDNRISHMANGQIMILECNGLPQSVFNQMFKMASLPAIVEGANTSNLMQLIGKPYMSARTNDTKFPLAENTEAIKELKEVEDALTGGSALNDKCSECLEDEEFNSHNNALIKIDLIIKFKEYRDSNIEELYCILKKRCMSSDYEKYCEKKQYNEKAFIKLRKEISSRIEILKEEFKVKLRPELNKMGLEEDKIAKISDFLKHSQNKESIIGKYFEKVASSAKEPERNQVLQGIKLFLDSLK